MQPNRKATTFRHRAVLMSWLAVIGLAAVAFLVVRGPVMPAASGTAASAIPAPTLDEPATGRPKAETAVLAGGCFWGVQGVFQHVKGVSSAQSGYAGGDAATANYETVSSETTGHAESVRITYDPTQVSYGKLLQIFFAVVQDPTELNRQGPDVGPSYRSVIFAQDDTQQKIANAYIAQLNAAGVIPRADRHHRVAADSVFPGGGLPPGLPRPASEQPVHRRQRPAQAGRAQVDVPGPVPRLAELSASSDSLRR